MSASQLNLLELALIEALCSITIDALGNWYVWLVSYSGSKGPTGGWHYTRPTTIYVVTKCWVMDGRKRRDIAEINICELDFTGDAVVHRPLYESPHCGPSCGTLHLNDPELIPTLTEAILHDARLRIQEYALEGRIEKCP